MTSVEFLVLYPEFRNVSANIVETLLGYAQARLSRTVLGESFDEAVGLLTADMLATRPNAAQARPKGDEVTQYGRALRTLLESTVTGAAISGVVVGE